MGKRRRPAPATGTAALRHASIVLPDATAQATVIERVERAGGIVEQRTAGPVITDPSGNALLLTRPDAV